MASNERSSELDHVTLRGIAILLIALHNYCHKIPGIVQENEYTFHIRHAWRMLYIWLHPEALLPLHVISFVGHYGVPVFLFLSAYGLERKYASREVLPAKGQFIGKHYSKLWRMMLPGYLLYIVVDLLTHPWGTTPYTIWTLLGQVTLTSTLFPSVEGMIHPGPYWYFGMLVQIYLLYRLVLMGRPWYVLVGVALLAWVLQRAGDPTGEWLNWMRFNGVGSVLPFVAGMLYARYVRVRMSVPVAALVLVASWVGIFLGSLYYDTWLWVPLLVVASAVAVDRLMPQWLAVPLRWVGRFSAAIFVTHATVREVVWAVERTWHTSMLTSLVLYFVLVLLVGYGYHWLSGRLGALITGRKAAVR